MIVLSMTLLGISSVLNIIAISEFWFDPPCIVCKSRAYMRKEMAKIGR